MAGEFIAFNDLFDILSTLSAELRLLIGRIIPVQLLRDNKSLFEVISKGSRTAQKRMILDIVAALERFKEGIISDIGSVWSSDNIVDGLTKEMNQAALRDILATGRLSFAPEQWIIRN